MSIKNDLIRILDDESVVDDHDILKAYSCDQSFSEPCMPEMVAFVKTVPQLQEVVKYANKTRIPIIPYSSGFNLHGATIPRQGGIIVNLSRMNAILHIDDTNWSCIIEPGVTASQLQDELEKHQLRAMLPFGVHPKRSALTSFLERDPAVAAASFEYGNELIMDTELVLPTGELFRTGLWSSGNTSGSPMGPVRAMVNRLWTGAQGTLGIMTKMNIKVEYLPRMRKIFLFAFDSFPEIMEPLRRIQRKEIGHECFVINNFNLAALMCKEWGVPQELPAEKINAREFEGLRDKLPEWLLVVCLNGGPRLPAGKLAYEEEELRGIATRAHMQGYSNGELEELLLAETLRPWGILKKFCYRGSVHDVSFKTPLKRIPEFQRILQEVTNKYDYPMRDIGMYVLPIERGRAMHIEIDFHGDPHDRSVMPQLKNMWLEISERFIDEGAFFDRPYGAWAAMVYQRAGTYTQKLKELKRALDPNNILNPGHLCF
jgi:hypothetical protein